MKTIHIALIISLLATTLTYAQNEFGGICHDNSGNLYCAGSFRNVLELGNKYTIKSKGESDVYIAKYESNGDCIWATRYGGLYSERVSDICSDSKGSTYVTGSFSNTTSFRNLKIVASTIKTYPSPNFYLVKLNISGDPVWVKSSINSGRDDGGFVVTDPAGNVYVSGTFDDKFECDAKSVTSKGKDDMFIMKLSAGGNLLWLKSFGDAGDNGCSAIYFSGDRIYAASSEENKEGYNAKLLCLGAGSGEIIWSKVVGTKKGSIDAITVDNDKAVLITGYVESRNGSDGQELIVAKYAVDGADIWNKRFTGGFPIGKALSVDQKNSIYLTGGYSDSLRMDRFNISGYPKEDVFLARLGPTGVTNTVISSGNSKNDRGSSLNIINNKIILGGTFTDGLEFGKNKLNGSVNTVFIASFEIAKLNCTNMKILSRDVDEEIGVAQTDIYGKLLIGTSQNKTFLSDQSLYLEDLNGLVLKRTITDEQGDFSFKNIDSNVPMNLVIDKNDKVSETQEIYLATQTGIIMDKMTIKDQKFKYHIISAEIVKMQEMPEENVELKFQEFGTNGGKEFMVTERISYESGSWSVPVEAIPDLKKIAQHMKRFSRIRLEINGHTDALGDETFNKNLSTIRGEEVKEFLVKLGVSMKRISVIGHGEENIINRCHEGVNCSESEHAYNRRTEFRFYMGPGL
ncbi:OmpA family protein [Aurantibacillus circumpalustris]|uniref:OmpA family protein n=1 Tax=Aurantibacillus circumpalustris TaxID=3036359 RepID=UPI00295BCB26|nr:OmpA family protein [Aurantibacillus circumpalustris]